MAFLPLLTPRGLHSTRQKRPRICRVVSPCACTSEKRTESLRPESRPFPGSTSSSPPSTSNDDDLEAVLKIHPSIHEFEQSEWDALASCGTANPFLRFHFLAALEDSNCVCAETGWAPRHISVRDSTSGKLLAAVPAYAKTHSMGEFVFDSSWAEASYAWGKAYYPKLLIAPPFTPATGRRILTAPHVDAAGGRSEMLRVVSGALVGLCSTLGVSGAHVNFVEIDEADALERAGFMRRLGVQYHFVNEKKVDNQVAKFSSFDDYLAEFRSKRRSNIRRERRAVRENAGLKIEVVQGEEIDEALLDEMFWIYKSTIDKMFYGRQYLNKLFFRKLGECDEFKEGLCFVLARRCEDNKIIAGTFNVVGDKSGVFFGRYWGCLEEHKYLHFEACYYAAIEYVIDNGLTRMEPGAGGGDFKYMRGFEPTTTTSMHYLRDSKLARAVKQFLTMETLGIDEAVVKLREDSAIRAKQKKSDERRTQC